MRIAVLRKSLFINDISIKFTNGLSLYKQKVSYFYIGMCRRVVLKNFRINELATFSPVTTGSVWFKIPVKLNMVHDVT